MAGSPQWWLPAQAASDRRAPPAAAALPEYNEAPRQVKLRTIGILKKYEHPDFTFYEYRYLVWVRDVLTIEWPFIQGGCDNKALDCWMTIFWVLELDRKAQLDLMLLAHQGEVGRCEANEVLWQLLSIWALKPNYEDLSNKCTSMVYEARRHIDRPPKNHFDSWGWSWARYCVPRHPQWSPTAVPRDVRVKTGPGGVPLAPPTCWQ